MKIHSLAPHLPRAELGFELHDPLCVWYALSSSHPGWTFVEEDIRIETAGQWTRGTCIVDRRGRVVKERTEALDVEVIGDTGGWGDTRRGNRVQRCVGSPGPESFGGIFLERVFGD